MTRKKVLIVEDDPDIRSGLELLVGREFHAVTAEDSISALIAARREQPDAMLLDLGLPGGDGLTVLDRMKAIPELASLPAIVVTGRCGESVEYEALSRGALSVFEKPADSYDLLDALRDAVAMPRAVSKHVLIVEDDDDVREGLAVRLRAGGFAVSCAPDGPSAVANARRLRPDLIVLDLGLPGGGGEGVLERLRSGDDTAEIPVVVVSGRENAEGNAIAAGADAFLQKPVAAAELLDAVDTCI